MLQSLDYIRPDGTFVGTVNDKPYHIIPGEPLWDMAQDMAAVQMPPLEPEPEPEPSLAPLTARQLRLGLVAAAGILPSQVDTAIAAIPDEAARAVAEIEWEYASQFERNHPLIEQVGTALGLTTEQIDTMWQAAMAL